MFFYNKNIFFFIKKYIINFYFFLRLTEPKLLFIYLSQK